MATGRDYGSWKLAELKDELGKRKSKRTGKKADLVKRLDFYDRNKNVGHEQLQDENIYTITTPLRAVYKDINADTEFPNVTLHAVDSYLTPFGTSLDQKIKNLYQERFLYFVRAAPSDGKYFASACCAAEMKKSVLYKVDIVIDKEGAVLESQCECAVGAAPDAHCKHVKCVLFALVSFSRDRQLLTKETCTQRLQTFHHCKPYRGSPLKASKLQLRSSDGNRNLQHYTNFDPRPQSMVRMESYSSFFRNSCINYQASSAPSSSISLPMPIMQTIPPANIYGVANDHDYMKDHPADLFLEKIGVKNIQEAQIIQIEEKTRGQSTVKRWKSERCIRLTSSNFGRICKCTDRTDKVALARSYVTPTKIDTAPIRHGLKYEHVAVDNYEKLNSVTTVPCGMFISNTHPFIGSSPDRVVNDQIVLEVKCPYVCRDKAISPLTVPYLQMTNGMLRLNPHHDYYFQVQGQMFCSGRQQCHFVIYTFEDMKVIVIDRDEDFIRSMVSDVTDFYEHYFKKVLLDKYFYKETDKYTFDEM